MSDRDPVVRLAARGDGATASGRFIPFAAPGDSVADDGSIVPGPHHSTPPCRHFPECGGCQLQHVDDEAYGDYLTDRIVSALAAPSEAPPGGQVLLGFNAQASHRIVDMRECHILHPQLFALVAPLRTLLAGLLSPRGGGEVRMTLAEQGPDLLLERIKVEGLAATEQVTAFAAEHRLARLAIDDGYGPQTLWEPEPVTIRLGPVSVPLPYGAFLQATAEGEAALVAAVADAMGEARIIADLFAGLGTFALSLPGRIFAAEGARDAALALKSAANLAQRPVFVDHRDLFRRPLDREELARFEAVILDPPRAGAKDQVASLAASPVAKIAYVSCNPATFARDAATLIAGGYGLSWVKPVGQFRWSTHVELAACFERIVASA